LAPFFKGVVNLRRFGVLGEALGEGVDVIAFPRAPSRTLAAPRISSKSAHLRLVEKTVRDSIAGRQAATQNGILNLPR
jgi:hypothetical protein